MTAVPGVGVVGFGEIGAVHCAELAGMAEARLAAIADPDAARREAAGAFGVPVLADVEALLARPDVDAVVVAAPDTHHRDACLAAAAAGKAILVEKPIATTLADADAVIDAAGRAGVPLMVGHTLRFFPEYRYAFDRVRAGEAGQLVSLFARRTNVLAQQTRLGGRASVLMFLGVHDLDVFRWLAGAEATRVWCEASAGAPGPSPTINEAFVTVRFANDVIAAGHFGWYLPGSHPSGFDFKLDVTGSGGVIGLDFARNPVSAYTASGASHPLITAAYREELRAFLRHVASGGPSPCSGADGRAALAMALAAEQSATAGRPIDLPPGP